MCMVEEENRFCWGMLGGLCACLEHWRLCKALAVHRVISSPTWAWKTGLGPLCHMGQCSSEKSSCAHVCAVSEARS